MYTFDDFAVLLDYGHNPAALEATLNFASRLGYRRIVGVVGVPGDRNDDLIRRCGQVCRGYLDQVIFKEDDDLRGRPSGETAMLLREGFLQGGRPFSGSVHTVLAEREAVRFALDRSEPGDLVVIFYEHREPIEDLLRERRREGAARDPALIQAAP